MRKWFSGKVTKQEFDREAREIVTDNYGDFKSLLNFQFNNFYQQNAVNYKVHLHNEFLLCIITKCNTFSSVVTEAATKPLDTSYHSSLAAAKSSQRPKKKFKSESNQGTKSSSSYYLRFVPVDSINHAPSIRTASYEAASSIDTNFSLEFCARERSLPYFKMIHGRLLLGAIDFNLQHVDIKAVFLVAEATIWMLKNILSKLSSRSEFRNKLRCESSYNNFKTMNSEIGHRHHTKMNSQDSFDFDPDIFKNMDMENLKTEEKEEQDEEEDTLLKDLGSNLNNPLIVPNKKLPTSLFDLKNLLQVTFSKI